MSISSSLNNAVSGMAAASRLAEVISSNVSNSLTDGYGRRSLNLSAAVVGSTGAGVEIGSVNRHVDRGILTDRRMADASLGSYGAMVSTMSSIQSAIGSVGDQDSISSRIVAVESALIDAATDPSSEIRLSNLGGRLGELASSLNDASGKIQTLRAQADGSIAEQVERLNSALSQVERLNKDISYSLQTNGDASGLMDQRQRVVDEISKIVPVRELDRDNGQIALMTPTGESLIDGRAKTYEFSANPIIVADMTIQSGALNGLTLDGISVGTDGFGKLEGGTLSAAFAARDGELVSAQQNLDDIASDLISRMQTAGVDPTLTAGQPGLLTDGGVAYDPLNYVGLAGRISVNAAVDPAQGGAITNLRDGVEAVTAGPAGDASLLQSLSSAFSSPLASSGDLIQQGAAGRAAKYEAEAGTKRIAYEAELSFSNARWASLREAETEDGVNTDYEMQMLLRVEQAYAANARLIQAVKSMMQSLMEI